MGIAPDAALLVMFQTISGPVFDEAIQAFRSRVFVVVSVAVIAVTCVTASVRVIGITGVGVIVGNGDGVAVIVPVIGCGGVTSVVCGNAGGVTLTVDTGCVAGYSGVGVGYADASSMVKAIRALVVFSVTVTGLLCCACTYCTDAMFWKSKINSMDRCKTNFMI